MIFTFFHLHSLCKDIRRKHKSIEHFTFSYNKVDFDVIIDIDCVPFQMMIGAVNKNLAFILNIREGYKTEIPNDIYYKLTSVLQMNFNDDHFTSFKFLKYIDNRIPPTCSKDIVNPDYLLRFRPYKHINVDESKKTRFVGWNDHVKDGKKAQNFDKTERYLGKAVADFCRIHNISSMWTTPNDKTPRNINFPPGYPI